MVVRPSPTGGPLSVRGCVDSLVPVDGRWMVQFNSSSYSKNLIHSYPLLEGYYIIYDCQSEGFERIIQVPGCDDCTGLGYDKILFPSLSLSLSRALARSFQYKIYEL